MLLRANAGSPDRMFRIEASPGVTHDQLDSVRSTSDTSTALAPLFFGSRNAGINDPTELAVMPAGPILDLERFASIEGPGVATEHRRRKKTHAH